MAQNGLTEPPALTSVFIVFVYPATQVYASDPSFFNNNPHQLVQMAGIAIDGLKASIAPKS